MGFVTHSLDPIYDQNARVLILGTMPSPKSREYGFYYSHPQNRFWRVLSAVFGEPIPQNNGEKKSLVLAHHIALWDVWHPATFRARVMRASAIPLRTTCALFSARHPSRRSLRQAKRRRSFTAGSALRKQA